jgi:hypothetical protein
LSQETAGGVKSGWRRFGLGDVGGLGDNDESAGRFFGGELFEETDMSTITVPLTVTPEAAARVTQLGMQREFEQMLEHVRQTVPGLVAIEVELALPYDTGDYPSVLIQPIMKNPHLEYDPTDWDYATWKVQTFPPEVCMHFSTLSRYETPNER